VWAFHRPDRVNIDPLINKTVVFDDDNIHTSRGTAARKKKKKKRKKVDN
jgi:hypothetical protein